MIQAFGIRGLYGYRNISLSSEFAATILIAKNGTGKTTLLGALDAFLRQQFFRLSDLAFEEIYCRIRGVDDDLVLTRSDLELLLKAPEEGELLKLGRRLDIPPVTLFKFLTEDWPTLKANIRSYPEYPTYPALLRAEGFSFSKTEKICDNLIQEIYSRSPAIARISSILTNVLLEHDIVYLPTYRRVELALRGDTQEPSGRRKRPRFEVAAGSLFTGDIQFGLSDISERLAQMNAEIVSESNNGYRKISASIINELLDGSFGNHTDGAREIPSRDDLQLFFSRLEDGRSAGPYFPVSPPNLDKIYNDDGVPAESARFLNYFLSQLDKVITTTRQTERSVEDFVHSCNKYLSSEELSTQVNDAKESRMIEGKELVLNRKNLMVHVQSLPEARKISLDALSSGEKQMISLFAKLFLYKKSKIVRLDEPELSLSIDWQREILVDVITAPLCEQVIAITHSPFVFDNELEIYARSLQLSKSSPPADEFAGDDIDE